MLPKQIGRFEIVSELARATHGGIYKAIDPRTRRTVAIRTIGAQSPELPKLQGTLRQAQTLESPNIVRVQAIGDFEGGCYVVTEYVEGRTLRSLLSGEELSSWEITDVVRQICGAIDHAHSRHLAHTNLSPANILVESDGTVKIMDYGLVTDPGESAQAGRNRDALQYLSPEQVRGEEPTWLSNLFSLGAILYEMISRSKPWAGEVEAVLDRILHCDPAPPHTVKAMVDPRTSTVVMKAMAKSPAERYPCGADLIRDLEKSYQSVPAPVATPQKPDGTVPPPAPAAKVPRSAPQSAVEVAHTNAPVPSPAHQGKLVNNPQAESAVQDGQIERCSNRVDTNTPAATPPAPREFLIVGPRDNRIATPSAPPRRIVQPKRSHRMLYAAAAVLLVGGLFASYAALGSRSHGQKQPLALSEAPAPTTDPAEAVTNSAAPQKAVIPHSTNRTRKRKPSLPSRPTPIPTGQLLIDSSPRGALIQLDGQSTPTLMTPYTANMLSPGSHTIVVSKAGYASESRTVQVSAGQQSILAVSLKELGATVSMSSRPEGAEVFVDGNDLGRTTPVGVTLPKGGHTLVFRKTGFLEAKTNVQLTPGQVVNVSPILAVLGNAEAIKPMGKLGRFFHRSTSRNMGKLEIKTNPKGAQVMINQRVLDKTTPAEFTAPAGTYKVTLMLPGHKPVRRTVNVNAGSTSVVDEPLQ